MRSNRRSAGRSKGDPKLDRDDGRDGPGARQGAVGVAEYEHEVDTAKRSDVDSSEAWVHTPASVPPRALVSIGWRPSSRALLLGLVLLLGVSVAIRGPVDAETLLRLGSSVAARPSFTAAAILAMALMLTVGLPGSVCLWLVAPFHPPWLATVLLTVGGVAGAAGAYSFSSWVGRRWTPGAVGQRVVDLLGRQGDLLTQIALRVLPGFPHQIVNFGAGLLSLPKLRFLIGAAVGLAVKWAVYASAVYGVTEAVTAGEVLHPGVIIPLLVLTALLLTGAVVRRRAAER